MYLFNKIAAGEIPSHTRVESDAFCAFPHTSPLARKRAFPCRKLVLAVLFVLAALPQVCAAQLPATPDAALQQKLCRRDTFHSYVECNGRRVEALFYMRNDGVSVGLGCEDYSVTAIDTTLAGRLVVPQSVTAPDGCVYPVTSVSRHSLADCRHITDVVVSEGIHDIGDQAFMNCRSLRTVSLPSTTAYLWPYAFRGCTSLRQVKIVASVPPDSYNDVFDERTLRFATLVVPGAYAEAYHHAFVWNMFRYCVPDFDL